MVILPIDILLWIDFILMARSSGDTEGTKMWKLTKSWWQLFIHLPMLKFSNHNLFTGVRNNQFLRICKKFWKLDLIYNKFHIQQSQAQIEIHLTFTWCSLDHLTIIWPSPDPHKTLTLPWLREFKLHLKFTWHSPGFPSHSPDINLTTWPSSDLPLTLTRPLPNIDYRRF